MNEQNKKMLSAEEARKMALAALVGKVHAILAQVELLAAKGRRTLRTGQDYTQDEALWIEGAYRHSPEWCEAADILQGLGYTVTAVCDEGMYIEEGNPIDFRIGHTRIDW